MIRLCTALLLVLALVPWAHATQAPDDPDALYVARADRASALAAAAIWERRLAERPADFEAAWKLARVCYWLGGHMPEGDWRGQLERGIAAGQRAISADPKDPAGHFWLAATMGLLAEQGSTRDGLRLRVDIKRELEIVLVLDPAFQRGSADRGLGRWYMKVPRMLGGNHEKAEQHLRRSLTYDPVSSASRFFLAELLMERGRKDEARTLLQAILDTAPDAEWGPEDRDFQQRATAVLAQLSTVR